MTLLSFGHSELSVDPCSAKGLTFRHCRSLSACGNDSRLRLPSSFGTFGHGDQVKGKGELLLGFPRGFYKSSPPEPLLEMKVGGLLSLPLRILGALQLHAG